MLPIIQDWEVKSRYPKLAAALNDESLSDLAKLLDEVAQKIAERQRREMLDALRKR